MNRQRDLVFSPIVRSTQLLALHVLEREHLGFFVLTHPEAGKASDILSSQEAAHLNGIARVLPGNAPSGHRKLPGAFGVAFQAHRPLAAVSDLVVDGYRAGRIAKPACW